MVTRLTRRQRLPGLDFSHRRRLKGETHNLRRLFWGESVLVRSTGLGGRCLRRHPITIPFPATNYSVIAWTSWISAWLKKSADVGGGTYNIRRLVFGGKCVFIRSTLWGDWVLAATHKRYPIFGHTP